MRLGVIVFFFFSSRRRHTRWTGDWSSDVCSSDLGLMPPLNLYARVRVLMHILHARPRVQRAPGFPCALCRSRRVQVTQASGSSCRENAEPYPHVVRLSSLGNAAKS